MSEVESKWEMRNKNIHQDIAVGAVQINKTNPLSPNFGGLTSISIPEGINTNESNFDGP